MRRVIAFVAAGLVTGIAAWLGIQIARPEVLPIGAELPPIPVTGPQPGAVLRAEPGERLVVVFFHTDCGACLEQLRMLEAEIDRLGSVRLYLLTDEASVDLAAFARRWPKLSASARVSWGIAQRAEVRRRLGARSTPAIFVFGPSGRLQAKMFGQRRPAVILEAAGAGAARPATARAREEESRRPAAGGQESP